MDIKLIVLNMILVLTGLFVYAHYKAPKEKKSMLLEGTYFTAMQEYRNSSENSLLREKAIEAAKNYLESAGMDSVDPASYVDNDLK